MYVSSFVNGGALWLETDDTNETTRTTAHHHHHYHHHRTHNYSHALCTAALCWFIDCIVMDMSACPYTKSMDVTTTGLQLRSVRLGPVAYQ